MLFDRYKDKNKRVFSWLPAATERWSLKPKAVNQKYFQHFGEQLASFK